MMFTKSVMILALFVWKTSICHKEDMLKSQILTQLHLAKAKALHNLAIAKAKLHPTPHLLLQANPEYHSNSELIPEDVLVTLNNNLHGNLGNSFHNSADPQTQYSHQNYASNFANYYEGNNQTEIADGELSRDDFNFKRPMTNDNPIVQNDEYNLTNIPGDEGSNNRQFNHPNYTNNDELLEESAIVLPNQSRITYSVDVNLESNNTKARNDIDGIDIRKLKIYEDTRKIPNFPNVNLNDEKKSRKGHQDDLYEDDIFVSNDSNENSTESEDNESLLKVKGGNLTNPQSENIDRLRGINKDHESSPWVGGKNWPIPDVEDNNDKRDDDSSSEDIDPPVNKLKVPSQLGDGQLSTIEVPSTLQSNNSTHSPSLEILFPDTPEIDLLDNSNSNRDDDSANINKKNNKIQELYKTDLSEDPYDRLFHDDLDMISLFARTLNKDTDAPMPRILSNPDRFEKLPIRVVLPIEQEKQTIDRANFNENPINPIVTNEFGGYKEEDANLFNHPEEHFENLEDKEQQFTGPFTKTNINQQLLLRNAMLRRPNQQISQQYLTNPPQRSMSNQPITNHRNYPIRNEPIHLRNVNNIFSSPHQDTTRGKLLNHEGPKLETYDNSFYRLKQYIKGMQAHTLNNQRVKPQPRDSDTPTTDSFYPEMVSSYLLHFPTNSDYFGARYRREIGNWSDKKEKRKAHTLKNQRVKPQPGDSHILTTNSFYPERVSSYLLHSPMNSDYFGAEEKRKAHTLKNQRVKPQPGDSHILTTNSFYPERISSYLLHFPTNSDYFGARYRREIRNWSDKKEKRKALPLISLIIDPYAKLDMPKTIKNFGTVTRNAIEDRKAPVHHFTNMLASMKNAALATMRIPPHDMIIPSKYKITDRNPQTNELLGSIKPEDDNVFNKVGTIMRQSIESGQEALQHVTDIAHNARKTISSTRQHHFPKLLLPYAKIPAVVRTTKRKKLTLIAPRFADVGEEIPDDGEDNHIKLGHILDALSLSHPDKKQIGTMKITYRPKDKEVKLQSRFGATEEEEPPGQYVINNHLEGDDFNSEEVTEIIDVFHTIKEISSGRRLKELLSSVHTSDNDTITQSSEENLGNNWKFTKEMMEPFMGILSRRKSDGSSLQESLMKKDKRAAPASNYKEIENAAFANFLAGFEIVSSINPEVYRVYFHEPLRINRSEDVDLKEFQRDIKSSRLLRLPQPALLASRKDPVKDKVGGELVDGEKNLLGYNERKRGSK